MPDAVLIWLADGLLMSAEEFAGSDIGAALKLAAIADANSGSSSSQSPSADAPLIRPAIQQRLLLTLTIGAAIEVPKVI